MITLYTPLKVRQPEIAAYDATKKTYSTTQYLLRGKVCVTIAFPATDAGKTVDFTLNDYPKTVTLKTSRIFNSTSTYSEDGVNFDVPADGYYTLTAAVTTATIEGFSIRASDPATGIVEDFGNTAHSGPIFVEYNNDRYCVHREMISGDCYVSRNGEPLGLAFTGHSTNRNNNYHFGSCIFTHPTGVVVAGSGHNDPQLKVIFIPGGDWRKRSSERLIGGASSQLTYVHGGALKNGDILLFTRGDDNGSNHMGILYRVTNVDKQNYSYTVDILINAAANEPYPKSLEVAANDAGTEIVGLAWQSRNNSTSQWTCMMACVMDPAANGGLGKFYGLNPAVLSPTNVLGTSGTPRWSGGQTNNGTGTTESGAGIVILTNIASTFQRYCDNMLLNLFDWPTNADCLAAFFDTTTALSDPDAYDTINLRYLGHTGLARNLPATPFSGLVNSPNSYRVSAAMMHCGGQKQLDRCYLIMTDRESYTPVNDYAENVPLYYNWGGQKRVVMMRVENATTASPVISVIGTTPVLTGYTDCFIRPTKIDDIFLLEVCLNRMTDVHAQARRLAIDLRGGYPRVVPIDDLGW